MRILMSQGGWTCQRGVRFDDCLCLRTYHDGYMDQPPVMHFDLAKDPHEQHDLAPARPELIAQAMTLLDDWHGEMMRSSPTNIDPFMTVFAKAGRTRYGVASRVIWNAWEPPDASSTPRRSRRSTPRRCTCDQT